MAPLDPTKYKSSRINLHFTVVCCQEWLFSFFFDCLWKKNKNTSPHLAQRAIWTSDSWQSISNHTNSVHSDITRYKEIRCLQPCPSIPVLQGKHRDIERLRWIPLHEQGHFRLGEASVSSNLFLNLQECLSKSHCTHTVVWPVFWLCCAAEMLSSEQFLVKVWSKLFTVSWSWDREQRRLHTVEATVAGGDWIQSSLI